MKRGSTIPHYQLALELNPTTAETYYHLGAILIEMERHAEAIQALEQCLVIDPLDAEVCNKMGTTLAKMGSFQEALELTSDDPDV